ncbi:MAG: hypothetical protein G5703_06510 [Serratia symbiotica]|nr:hypothetical protein [Serratia symbiotica]
MHENGHYSISISISISISDLADLFAVSSFTAGLDTCTVQGAQERSLLPE